MPLTVGQTLQGNYRIIGLLGQGGMGAVYLAEHTRLTGRLLAIKENTPNPFADPATLAQFRDQFYTEAKILASLVHPALPQVSDYFSEDGVEYLVMDYVEGEDLQVVSERHLQQQGKPLPENLVLAWADEILSALEFMHSRQPHPVIHRDIKPSNIILTPEGKVRLVDFGLAKLMSVGQSTATGVRGMGTPDYTPLEQFPGSKSHTDARTDIFSLGATLYNLLAGSPPMPVRDRLLGTGQLTPLRQLNPAVSTTTEQAIRKAIEIQPGQRFQTAEQMRAALSSQVIRAAPPPRRRAGPAAAVLLVVALIIAGIVIVFNGGNGHGQPAAPGVLPSPELTITASVPRPPEQSTETPTATIAVEVVTTATKKSTRKPTAAATAAPPTNTPRRILTGTPRSTVTPPRESGMYQVAPILLRPNNGKNMSRHEYFAWQWDGPELSQDERYEWRLLRDSSGESVVDTRIHTVKATVYNVGNLAAGDYYWSLRVVQVDPNGKFVGVRSPEAPRRLLHWRPPLRDTSLDTLDLPPTEPLSVETPPTEVPPPTEPLPAETPPTEVPPPTVPPPTEPPPTDVPTPPAIIPPIGP